MTKKLLPYHVILMCYIDGNASKPRISKMHNVQETQKKMFQNKLATQRLLLLFLHFDMFCMWLFACFAIICIFNLNLMCSK